MKKKVLVTGAKGQLGLTLKELFKDSETYDFHFKSKDDLDIQDPNALKALFESNDFAYCINCAAYTNVEQAEKTPEFAYAVNAEAVRMLSEFCKDFGVILIHISTDYVFDGTKKEPYEVWDEPNPINEYGKSKLKGEQYIQEILNTYYIIRTSWLYSKTYGRNFYKTILKKIDDGEELRITDAQLGCPTNCINLANFIVNHIMKYLPSYGIFHYCDNHPMTWYDFASSILKEQHVEDQIDLIRSNDYVTLAKRPSYSVLKSSN